MAKLPDNRRPYDPAKAARERAAAAEAARIAAATPPAIRKVHRHGLRPLPPTGDED